MEPDAALAPDVRRNGGDAVQAIVAAGVLLASGAVAQDGVSGAERRVFELANRQPNWLEPVLWLPMQLGSLWGPFAAGAFAWWRTRSWRPAAGAVVVGVVAWQLAKAVKGHVERGRPLDELGDIVQRWGTPKDGLGFVSGHSAVSFAVAGVLSPYLSPWGRFVVRALAAKVGFARMHVGAHLPLDVVGGAALGHLLAMVWRLAVGTEVAGTGRMDAESVEVAR